MVRPISGPSAAHQLCIAVCVVVHVAVCGIVCVIVCVYNTCANNLSRTACNVSKEPYGFYKEPCDQESIF